MQDFLYRNFVQVLSSRVETQLTTIETQYGYEYGTEFEIVICEILRELLPEKYGIVRGYVVDQYGNTEGDDIIIFDKSIFPTLLLRKQDSFARKEYIPIEAVYCYIEAKHTINLSGDDGQSFSRASQQVSNVKRLCNTRKKVPIGYVNEQFELGNGFEIERGKNQRFDYLNPVYGVVVARQVRYKKGDSKLLKDPLAISNRLTECESPDDNLPDILIIGKDNILIPIIPPKNDSEKPILSHFFIDGVSMYGKQPVESIAFGIGFLSILNAIRKIQLGNLPYEEMIGNALSSNNPYIGTKASDADIAI